MNNKTNKKRSKNRSLWDFGMTSILILLLFRIPISNMLGSEGNGYLAITWEWFTVWGIFFGMCIGKAVTRMVKIRMSKHQYHNSTRILYTAIITGIVWSAVGGLLMYALSGVLTDKLLGVKLSGISLRLSGLLLVFGTTANVFRGYFEGSKTKIPTYFSKIIEVLVAGTGACIFAFLLGKYGKKVGALLLNAQYEPAFIAVGIIAGCILGSIISIIFLCVVNGIYQIPLTELYKKDETRILESQLSIVKEIFKMSWLAILPVLFYKGYRMLNIGIYIRSKMEEGTTIKTIQQIGSYHGRILVIAGIICVLILGVTGKNLRKIQKYYIKNDFSACGKFLLEDLKIILGASVGAMVILLVLSKSILQLVFRTGTQSEIQMLQVASAGILVVVTSIYMYKVLQALGEELPLLVILVIAFIGQTILMLSLVKIASLGAITLVIAELVFWTITALLEGLLLFKLLKPR